MLELADRKLENAEVVVAKGYLDHESSCLFDVHCTDLLSSGCKTIFLDFNDLQFLSSDGLRVILGLSKRFRAAGGKLVFTGIHGPIRDMFDIAGFLNVLPVVDQVESNIA